MTGPGPTSALVLLLSVGTPLLVRSVAGSRREVEAVAASNRALATQAALFQAKRDSRPTLEAEAAERKAAVARSLTLFPSPEIATPEWLLERLQECCERSKFQLKNFCIKPCAVRPVPRTWSREIDTTHCAEGSFAQLVHFLALLEQGEPFVRVNSFTVTAGRTKAGDEGPLLTLAFNISTFRVDDSAR